LEDLPPEDTKINLTKIAPPNKKIKQNKTPKNKGTHIKKNKTSGKIPGKKGIPILIKTKNKTDILKRLSLSLGGEITVIRFLSK
jgi:hypothetical protein